MCVMATEGSHVSAERGRGGEEEERLLRYSMQVPLHVCSYIIVMSVLLILFVASIKFLSPFRLLVRVRVRVRVLRLSWIYAFHSILGRVKH